MTWNCTAGHSLTQPPEDGVCPVIVSEYRVGELHPWTDRPCGHREARR